MNTCELITIVVPVYNVKRYLRQCIDSLICQTYHNLQIILVDDGSTDQSGDICDYYAITDDRISVIHKQNGGLSSARNEGLKNANGEIIAFVDSDDYVHHEMYERLYSAMIKEKSDIVSCGIIKVYDETDVEKSEPEEGYKNVDKPDIMKCIYERGEDTVVQWNKIFKKDILHGLEYPVGRIHEDEFVIHKELIKCKRITYLNAKLYYYRQRAGSIMNVESIAGINDGIDGIKSRIEFFKNLGMNKEMIGSISALLKYLNWRIDTSAETEKFSDNTKWMIEQYSSIYSKYGEYLPGRDEDAILNNPKRYCEHVYWNKIKYDVKKKIKGIIKRK